MPTSKTVFMLHYSDPRGEWDGDEVFESEAVANFVCDGILRAQRESSELEVTVRSKELVTETSAEEWVRSRMLEAQKTRNNLGNQTAQEGYDRCECGCKYWENDTCIDCGTKHNPMNFMNKEAHV